MVVGFDGIRGQDVHPVKGIAPHGEDVGLVEAPASGKHEVQSGPAGKGKVGIPEGDVTALGVHIPRLLVEGQVQPRIVAAVGGLGGGCDGHAQKHDEYQ